MGLRGKGIIIVLLLTATVICAWLLSTRIYAQADDAELQTVVLEGCKQATSAVKSGKGKITVQEWSRSHDGSVFESTYENDIVFRGELFKLRLHLLSFTGADSDGATMPITNNEEIVSFDGQTVKTLDVRRRTGRINSPETITGSDILMGYEMKYAVGSRKGLGNGVCDVLEFYKSLLFPETTATGPYVVGRDTIEDDLCIIVECRYEFTKPTGEKFHDIRRFWINTDKGYTLKRVRVWNGDQITDRSLAAEYDVSVRQYPCGIWGPNRVEETQYYFNTEINERMRMLHRLILFDASFALNVPVGDDELLLTFPSGTTIHDEVLDASYDAL